MSNRAHGRGAIATIGLIVLFAGIVGGVVLWILAGREPDATADGFARAAPGCTTTVTFAKAGEYYVYEELSGVVRTVEGCEPTTTPGQAFAFDIRPLGGEPIERVTDTSVTYDLDAGVGVSVARVSIGAPGDYAVSVLGNDPAVNAAIGADPEDGVDDLRRGAIAAVAVGVVIGVLLLWLAGRRSRKAATFASPIDPGWGVTERDHARRAADDSEWAAPTSDASQVPVNPHLPESRRVAGRTDDTGPDVGGPDGWSPPTDVDSDVDVAEPVLAGDQPSATHAVGSDRPDHDGRPAGTDVTEPAMDDESS